MNTRDPAGSVPVAPCPARTKRVAGPVVAVTLGTGAAAFALVELAAGLGLGMEASATGTALIAAAGAVTGYILGLRQGTAPAETRSRLGHVASELAQYQAFTHLVRDQGQRITSITTDAATAIVAGLVEIDAGLARLAKDLEAMTPGTDARPAASAARALAEPVADMLGKVQFQDITQQQIAFIARLSLLVDDHMILLAGELGDQPPSVRAGQFQSRFARALDDCVMDSQRDDHHTAMGLSLQEDTRPAVELF